RRGPSGAADATGEVGPPRGPAPRRRRARPPARAPGGLPGRGRRGGGPPLRRRTVPGGYRSRPGRGPQPRDGAPASSPAVAAPAARRPGPPARRPAVLQPALATHPPTAADLAPPRGDPPAPTGSPGRRGGAATGCRRARGPPAWRGPVRAGAAGSVAGWARVP